MDKKPISLTQYYKKLSKSLADLIEVNQNFRSKNTYQATQEICRQGLLLEQESNPLIMQKIVGKIGMLANDIGPECNIISLENNKIRQYHLPIINDLQQLLFAVVYLNHLLNYKVVEYAGEITTYWGVDALSKINAGVESKKNWNEAQAKELENNIKFFCQNNKINFNEIIERNLHKLNFIKVISNKLKLANESINRDSIDSVAIEKDSVEKSYKNLCNKYNDYNLLFLEFKKIEKDFLNSPLSNQTFFNQFYNWFLPNERLITYNKVLVKLKNITPPGYDYADYLKELESDKQLTSIEYNKILYKYFTLKSNLKIERLENGNICDEAQQDIIIKDKLHIKFSAKALSNNNGFFKLEVPTTKKMGLNAAVGTYLMSLI